jgi:alpha/beta superfamily hydrolase
MSDQARIRSFYLDGPAGRLEALLNEGQAEARYAGIVCHPHPLYGGTMHNKVVFHAMKELNSFGFPVLRFNFRGVGHSAGTHDSGRGEIDDVRAGLEWLKREFKLPVIFAGFSFGAATGLRLVCPDPAVPAIISLGTPLSAEGRLYQYSHLSGCTKPKLFVSGDHDQYANAEQLERVVSELPEPKRLVIVPGDHFFAGHLDEMRAAVGNWLREVVLREAPSPV